MNEATNKKRVIIIGGGFAGLNLAKRLTGNRYLEVTVVDQNNYHFFPPLLYQVSTAFIEASNISHPFRRLFQDRPNVRFHFGSLLQVFPDTQTIETDTGFLNYDYLVLAMGTETNYFGMQNVKEHALPMKSIDDALNLRNHLLLTQEKAVRSTDIQERERLQNIVIAGGGPTGVEIAGMLAEMGRNIVAKDYPEMGTFRGKIYLVDAGATLLGPMSKKSQEEALHVLKDFGVQIILNTAVKDYVNDTVLLANGQEIPAATLIWASGVIARDVPGLPKETFTRGRRLLVDEVNRVQGYPNIFAIGDQAFMTADPKFPNSHPQVAQPAIQQGKLLATNLTRLEKGEALKPFRYNDKGNMAIIAKYKAVADLPKLFFKGFFAWLVWLFIHIIPLVGFRNKVQLFFAWMYAFITNDPTLRLIIRPREEDKRVIGKV